MRWLLSMSAALLTSLSAAAVAAPQQEADRQDQAQRQQSSERGPAEAGRLDEKTKRSTVRASQLIGMEIQNSQGEDIGDIEDLVLEAASGKIKYAAVSYGGFLGLGDKLFAVPWEAFQAKPGENREEYVLMLDVSEQELENAQGFSEDNWPDFGDRKFTEQVDKRYGVDRTEQNGGVSVDAQRGEGVSVDVDGEQRQNRDR